MVPITAISFTSTAHLIVLTYKTLRWKLELYRVRHTTLGNPVSKQREAQRELRQLQPSKRAARNPLPTRGAQMPAARLLVLTRRGIVCSFYPLLMFLDPVVQRRIQRHKS